MERKEVQKSFKKLEFFSTNLKPRSVLEPGILHKIDLLVKSAFDCHLDKEDDTEKVAMISFFFIIFVTFNVFPNEKQKAAEKKKKKRTLCLFCEVKQVLLKYESLIFDKTFVDDVDRENVGNWNPSYQEAMLRGM